MSRLGEAIGFSFGAPVSDPARCPNGFGARTAESARSCATGTLGLATCFQTRGLSGPRSGYFGTTLFAVFLACTILAVAGAAPAAEAHRPWATPLKQPGVPNLHRVTTNLFRSAQPTAAGMKSIEEIGRAHV